MRALLFLLAFALTARAQIHPSLPEPGTLDGLGVNIHFTEPQPGELEMIRTVGFRWVRMDFTWAATEREAGRYDFAKYDSLLAALEKGAAREFHPRLRASEIWKAGSGERGGGFNQEGRKRKDMLRRVQRFLVSWLPNSTSARSPRARARRSFARRLRNGPSPPSGISRGAASCGSFGMSRTSRAESRLQAEQTAARKIRAQA